MTERALETDVDRRARAWSKSGHLIAWSFATEQRQELNDALYDVIEPLEEDEPIDPEDVRQARNEIDMARELLEEWIIPMVEDIEPWDSGGGSTTPHNVFREHLEDVGYTVIPPDGEGEPIVDLSTVTGDASPSDR